VYLCLLVCIVLCYIYIYISDVLLPVIKYAVFTGNHCCKYYYYTNESNLQGCSMLNCRIVNQNLGYRANYLGIVGILLYFYHILNVFTIIYLEQCFQCILCCRYSAVTVYGTCNVTFLFQYFVRAH
jgi:hypothetical protein